MTGIECDSLKLVNDFTNDNNVHNCENKRDSLKQYFI